MIMALSVGVGVCRRTARTVLLGSCLLLLLGAGCGPAKKPLATRFYPPPPETPQIQFLTRIASSSDVVPPGRLQMFIKGEEPPNRFIKPYGVKTRDGIIYVCDTRRAAVAEIDLADQKFEWLPNEGPGKLRKPVNLAVDEDRTKYVADLLLGQVVVFDHANRFQRVLGSEGQFQPIDVAVFKEQLYLLDHRDQEVKILDKNTGAVMGSFGGPPMKEGRLSKPSNLYIDPSGYVYVTNTLKCRVEKYDSQGNHLDSLGACGESTGSFIQPRGVAVDDRGFIYVVDTALEHVQRFSPGGDVALSFGGPGDASVPGALWLPSSIAVTYDKTLIASLDNLRAPDFNVDHLILVMSQFGPPYLNIYAYGQPGATSVVAGGDARAVVPEAARVESVPVPEEVARGETVATGGAEAAVVGAAQPLGRDETARETEEILALVEHWRRCWESLDFSCYIEHYGKGFKHGRMDFAGWRAYKSSIFRQKKHVSVQFEDIRVVPSGSNRQAHFMQTFRSGRLSDYGEKVLTLGREEGAWKILAEQWTAAERVAKPTVSGAGDDEAAEILEFVDQWKNCWESLDFECYMQHYGQNFRHYDMDLADWRDFRGRVLSQQKNVRLTLNALEISGFGSDRKVRFMQTFRSQRHSDVGQKTLTVRKEGGRWKIIREEWKAR